MRPVGVKRFYSGDDDTMERTVFAVGIKLDMATERVASTLTVSDRTLAPEHLPSLLLQRTARSIYHYRS